jgi:hypothetical protein
LGFKNPKLKINSFIQKQNNKVMKNEIIYKNRTIIENTDGTFSAFYSNYSSHLVKTFKTLAAAKKQIDKWA